MHTFYKYKFNKINFLNFFIIFTPVSLLLGNLAVNINIILICILGGLIYKKELLVSEEKKILFALSLFFFYTFLISAIKYFPELKNNDLFLKNFLKSIFFFRFFFLFLVVSKMIEKQHLKVNYFVFCSAFFSTFLAVDILIQIIFGKDLFGYDIITYGPNGFFKEEKIAGGYIQKFSLFCFYFINLFFLKKNIQQKYLFLFGIFLFFFIIQVFTFNRMTAILYIFSLIIFLIFEKKIKLIISSLISLVIIVSILVNINVSISPKVNELNESIITFYKKSTYIISKAPTLFFSKNPEEIKIKPNSDYILHFNSGVQVWKKNKIFGGGIKSFIINCSWSANKETRIKNQICNTHPHNYVLEIMVSTGLVGLSIILYIVFCLIDKFRKFYFFLKKEKSKLYYFPFGVIIFIEFFPIRSTGSFFSTQNAFIIFLFIAFLVNISKLKNNR